jgi:hypothetical protein
MVYCSFTVLHPTGEHYTIVATAKSSPQQFRSMAERRRTKRGRSEPVANPMVENNAS